MRHFVIMVAAGILAASAIGSSSAQVAVDAKGKSTKGFVVDIEKLTGKNSDYRHVLYTGKNLQLVLMSIQPGEEIGEEVHGDGDQFFRIEKGKGEVWINGNRSEVEASDAILVPAGARPQLAKADVARVNNKTKCGIVAVTRLANDLLIPLAAAQ